MNIIDMKDVVGSDTLCSSIYGDDNVYETIQDNSNGAIHSVRVAENIWQSTANNLVIPEGLVCDVRYNSNEIISESYRLSSEDIKKCEDDGVFYDIYEGKPIQAVRVTGTQEDWGYKGESVDAK